MVAGELISCLSRHATHRHTLLPLGAVIILLAWGWAQLSCKTLDFSLANEDPSGNPLPNISEEMDALIPSQSPSHEELLNKRQRMDVARAKIIGEIQEAMKEVKRKVKQLDQQAMAVHQQQGHSLFKLQHGLDDFQDNQASSPNNRDEMEVLQHSQLLEELQLQCSKDQETIQQLKMELRTTQDLLKTSQERNLELQAQLYERNSKREEKEAEELATVMVQVGNYETTGLTKNIAQCPSLQGKLNGTEDKMQFPDSVVIEMLEEIEGECTNSELEMTESLMMTEIPLHHSKEQVLNLAVPMEGTEAKMQSPDWVIIDMPEEHEEDSSGAEEPKTTFPELCGKQEPSVHQLNTQNILRENGLVSKPKALQGWGSYFSQYIPLSISRNFKLNIIPM